MITKFGTYQSWFSLPTPCFVLLRNTTNENLIIVTFLHKTNICVIVKNVEGGPSFKIFTDDISDNEYQDGYGRFWTIIFHSTDMDEVWAKYDLEKESDKYNL